MYTIYICILYIYTINIHILYIYYIYMYTIYIHYKYTYTIYIYIYTIYICILYIYTINIHILYIYYIYIYILYIYSIYIYVYYIYTINIHIYIYTTWCHPTFEGTPSRGLGGFLARVPTDGKSCTRKSTELGIHLGAANLRCLGPHRPGGPGPRAVAMACFPVRKSTISGKTSQKSWICWAV